MESEELELARMLREYDKESGFTFETDRDRDARLKKLDRKKKHLRSYGLLLEIIAILGVIGAILAVVGVAEPQLSRPSFVEFVGGILTSVCFWLAGFGVRTFKPWGYYLGLIISILCVVLLLIVGIYGLYHLIGSKELFRRKRMRLYN